MSTPRCFQGLCGYYSYRNIIPTSAILIASEVVRKLPFRARMNDVLSSCFSTGTTHHSPIRMQEAAKTLEEASETSLSQRKFMPSRTTPVRFFLIPTVPRCVTSIAPSTIWHSCICATTRCRYSLGARVPPRRSPDRVVAPNRILGISRSPLL